MKLINLRRLGEYVMGTRNYIFTYINAVSQGVTFVILKK